MKYAWFFSSCLFSLSLFATTQHAYVTNHGGSTVQIIDVNQDLFQTISGFDHPRVVKVTSDGTRAYIGEDSGKLWAIDTITHTVSSDFLAVDAPVALAITPNSRFLYVVSKNDTVSVVRLEDFTIQATLTGFNDPRDIKIAPNGNVAYISNLGNGTVSVLRTSDNTVVDTITGMQAPMGVAVTNNGSHVYVTDPEHNVLYKIRTLDNTLIQTIFGFNLPRYIAMTPDDTYAYVSNYGTHSVMLLRLSDNQVLRTIQIPSPGSVAVTPDGLFLYVGSGYGAVFKIRTLDQAILSALPGYENPSNIALTNNNAPALSVNGCHALLPTPHNHITWVAAPGNPVQYKIYSDASLQHLIGSVSGGVHQFHHMDVIPQQTYWYYVIAVYSNGFSSSIGSVEVPPTRTCLGTL
jgi:YVTN family beta-propeller protein